MTDGRPFLVVHHLPEIKEAGVPYLMPGVPITCKVDNTEKYTTRSKVLFFILHGKSFTFFFSFGGFSWKLVFTEIFRWA